MTPEEHIASVATLLLDRAKINRKFFLAGYEIAFSDDAYAFNLALKRFADERVIKIHGPTAIDLAGSPITEDLKGSVTSLSRDIDPKCTGINTTVEVFDMKRLFFYSDPKNVEALFLEHLDDTPIDTTQTEREDQIQECISGLREGEVLFVPRERTDTGSATLIHAEGERYPLQRVRGRGVTEIYEILEKLSEESGRRMMSLTDLKRELGRDPEETIRNHQKALRTKGFPKLLALTGGVVGVEPVLRFWHQITLSPEVSP